MVFPVAVMRVFVGVSEVILPDVRGSQVCGACDSASFGFGNNL